ncbi:unnamed protein product [Auanema sp. JU1783]|nr:unnamed protein product [Auanema sp. JU1783]
MRYTEAIQTLYNAELYEEVVFLHELDSNTTGLTVKQEYMYNVYIADSYSYLEQYKHGIRHYELATLLYFRISRGVITKNFAESDVRYRYHKCLLKENRHEDALDVLLKVPTEALTPKICSAIAKMLHAKEKVILEKNMAVKYMRSIIESCPMAYKTLDELVRAGIKIDFELDRNFRNTSALIRAHKSIYENDIVSAVRTLTTEGAGMNRTICIELGKLFYMVGMRNDARSELAKAHAIDEDKADGMDILAYIYSTDSKTRKYLEGLAPTLIRNCPNAVETYIAFGYLSRALGGAKHLSSALQFSYKACNIKLFGGRTHSGAMLLKALVLKDMDRYADAITHLKEAIQDDPLNFDLYDTIISFFLQENSYEEARTILTGCSVYHGSDPRVHVLEAKLLMKRGVYEDKKEAQRMLERIVAKHPFLLDAAIVLMEYYEATNNFTKGIEMLNKLTNTKFPYSSLAMIHHLLGEFYVKSDKPLEAYNHFNLAIINGHTDSINELELINNALAQSGGIQPKQSTVIPRAPPTSPHSNLLPIPFNLSSNSPDPSLSNQEIMDEDPPQI